MDGWRYLLSGIMAVENILMQFKGSLIEDCSLLFLDALYSYSSVEPVYYYCKLFGQFTYCPELQIGLNLKLFVSYVDGYCSKVLKVEYSFSWLTPSHPQGVGGGGARVCLLCRQSCIVSEQSIKLALFKLLQFPLYHFVVFINFHLLKNYFWALLVVW